MALVREHGATEFTLYFEFIDMLPPATQDDPPDFMDLQKRLKPGVHHHLDAPHLQKRTRDASTPSLIGQYFLVNFALNLNVLKGAYELPHRRPSIRG